MDHLYVLVPLTLLATVQPELVGGVVEVSPPEAVANMDIENLDMERYYTVIIDNNDEDCFIFEAMQNSTLNLEYTVLWLRVWLCSWPFESFKICRSSVLNFVKFANPRILEF